MNYNILLFIFLFIILYLYFLQLYLDNCLSLPTNLGIIEKYTNNPNHLQLVYLDDVKHFSHQSINGKDKNANTVKLTPYNILDYTNPDITS